MLDNLIRLRAPAAWVVIAVTAASIVLASVRFALALPAGVPFTAAAQDVSLQAMNLSLVIVVVAVVWACVFHAPTRGAAAIAYTAAWVVTLGTALTLFGAIAGISASAGVLGVVLEFLGMALDIILKLVGTATLWLIVRGISAGRIKARRLEPAVAADPQPEPTTASEPEPEAVEPPGGPEPAWHPDAASGAVWTSASAAASGAPASGHGVPGEGNGWYPVARAPALPPGVDGENAAGEDIRDAEEPGGGGTPGYESAAEHTGNHPVAGPGPAPAQDAGPDSDLSATAPGDEFPQAESGIVENPPADSQRR